MASDKKMRDFTKASDDPLDAFMKQVKAGNMLDSMTRSKMHRRKAELSHDIHKFEKLEKLSAPVDVSKSLGVQTDAEKAKMKNQLLNRMRTKKKGFGITEIAKPKPTDAVKSSTKSATEVEIDSDEEVESK
jgi:hypothetical protein